MAENNKDTIYIDIDDEITSIIDKVTASKHKIVALVLPKRASALQSVVNMKLLKRASHEAGKSIVLITSETNLLPLAGIVGLYVAKTLQTKPVIPAAPEKDTSTETVEDGEPVSTETDEVDPQKSVGELSGLPDDEPEAALGAVAVEDTIDVDVPEPEVPAEQPEKVKKSKKDIKVPNFERFRLLLILGVLALVVLGVGGYFALNVLPKARIVVKTNTTTFSSSLTFSANSELKDIDLAKAILPATGKEVKKTDTLKITATGTKNVGDKAKGTITVTNCINDGQSHTIPAGSSFSSAGASFLSDVSITLDPALYSGSVCKSATFGLSRDVTVTASQSGDAYNFSARSYASAIAGISGFGSAMAGGTTKNLTVVSQQDLDKAKDQLTDKSKDAAVTDLSKQVKDAKLIPLAETLNGAAPSITSVPNVGDEATDVTVTSVTTYTMLGISADTFKKFLEADTKKQIDLTKQPIVDYGLDKATFHVTDKRSGSDQTVSLQATVVAGTKIDADSLKKEIIGKKRGAVQQTVQNHPGVTDVNVSFSPFWVTSVPTKPAKTTVVFEQTNKGATH